MGPGMRAAGVWGPAWEMMQRMAPMQRDMAELMGGAPSAAPSAAPDGR